LRHIVFLCHALSGSGHTVFSVALGNALLRSGLLQRDGTGSVEYTVLLADTPSAKLAQQAGFKLVYLPVENPSTLYINGGVNSKLFTLLSDVKPDIIIADFFWFALQAMVPELQKHGCRCVFTSFKVDSILFSGVPTSEPGWLRGIRTDSIQFDPHVWDACFALEPFDDPKGFSPISPIIVRNHNEILPKSKALAMLSCKGEKPVALLATNGRPGEFEDLQKTYAYLQDEGYDLRASSNFSCGIFPIADVFSAVDLLISGAGYYAFWEAQYFCMNAIFVPQFRPFEDQSERVVSYVDYQVERNGADELVEIIRQLLG